MKCPECIKWGVENEMVEYLTHYHCPKCGEDVHKIVQNRKR